MCWLHVVPSSIELFDETDGGFTLADEELEAGGDQEGGGWDVDEELELPPDLVSGWYLTQCVVTLWWFVSVIVYINS